MSNALLLHLLLMIVVLSFASEPSPQHESNSSLMAREPILECLLARKFRHVFRITSCGNNPTTLSDDTANFFTLDGCEKYPLCLWDYHLSTGESVQDQYTCERRFLYQVQFQGATQEREDAVSTLHVRWRHDMARYTSVWPHEAYAYKAHLQALELCTLWTETEEASALAGCIVITDDASWVAAHDGGKLGESLRRPVDLKTAAVGQITHRRLKSASATEDASSAFKDEATRNSADSPSTLIPASMKLPPFNVSFSSLRESGLSDLPWRQCHNRPGFVAVDADAAACRLYSDHHEWLQDLETGLQQLNIGVTRHESILGDAQNDAQPAAGSNSSWHVLALPSACAGFDIETDTGDIGDGADIVDVRKLGESNQPPTRRGIPGCILAFSPAGVSLVNNLASPLAAVGNTSSAMLPITNLPFLAKLNQLARQQLLRLAIATPKLPTADVPAESPVQAPSPILRHIKQRRFLLFTSAGDQGVWQSWASPRRNFDLIVAYYGNFSLDDPRVIAGCPDGGGPDYVYRSRGSKHQNLHRLHALYPNLLASYDIVAAWDDDLEIAADRVIALFERFASLSGPPGDPDGVWMGQPSLRNDSKISFIVLKNSPEVLLAYTSFVEVNAGLFRSDKLVQVLDSQRYTGELLGWGVDYAQLAILGPNLRNRYVVLHDFQVFNPNGTTKKMGHEILKLASHMDRKRQWFAYMDRFKMEEHLIVAHKCVPVDPTMDPDQLPLFCPENPAYQDPMHQSNHQSRQSSRVSKPKARVLARFSTRT